MTDAAFWHDRPTFVTGATGLVGSWLVRQLVELGADVTCLVRDWVPQSELVRSRLLERVKVVRGDKSRTKTLFVGAPKEDVERGLASWFRGDGDR